MIILVLQGNQFDEGFLVKMRSLVMGSGSKSRVRVGLGRVRVMIILVLQGNQFDEGFLVKMRSILHSTSG